MKVATHKTGATKEVSVSPEIKKRESEVLKVCANIPKAIIANTLACAECCALSVNE